VAGEREQPRVQPLSYVYTVFDAREQRVLGWHYHPEGRAGESISIPHLHIYVESQVGGRVLSKLHIPTGYVGPDEIVAFLIEEMGIEPREEYRRVERGEPRWRRILREDGEALIRLQGRA
jgi:hypothetical protein